MNKGPHNRNSAAQVWGGVIKHGRAGRKFVRLACLHAWALALREPWGAGAIVLGRRLVRLTGGAHTPRVDRARIELLD
eukprot:scaffold25922_cov39-Phaeocystis_antarctica.AAC.1